MKKDYSKRNLINAFGMSLPNVIGHLIGIVLSFMIIYILVYYLNYTEPFILLVFPLVDSFIGLNIAGKLLDKHCINNDIEKCKKCKNWNCTRNIKNEKVD